LAISSRQYESAVKRRSWRARRAAPELRRATQKSHKNDDIKNLLLKPFRELFINCLIRRSSAYAKQRGWRLFERAAPK
jgi:hypothetical protein